MKSNRSTTTLRLPDEIYKKLASKAQESGISINAYITMIVIKELEK